MSTHAKGDRKRNNHAPNGRKRKRPPKLTIASGPRPKHSKLDIKFDPQARRDYLTSRSSHKKERRTFGLAMQKVKDRKAKLQSKREEKVARLEQVEEAERNKRAMYGIIDDDEDGSSDDNEEEEKGEEGNSVSKGGNVVTFQDSQTQAQFGGQVVVTTTYGIDSDPEEEEDLKSTKRTNRDQEQLFAGSVQKYMSQLKGNLPSKRQKFQSGRGKISKKGQHGAEGMKGMGNASDLKMAQKTLDKFRGGKGGKGRAGGDRGGKRGKKGRGRR